MKIAISLALLLFGAPGFLAAQSAPETPPPATDAQPVKPVEDPPATNTPEVSPTAPPANTPEVVPPVTKPAEPELDEETRKQIEEAKQKILKEKAEREEAERKAREKEKENNERGFFSNLWSNTTLYAGAHTGLSISTANIHGTGFGFGGFVHGRLFGKYGLRVGVETGQYPAKSYGLRTGDYTLTVPEPGTFGYLAVIPALEYVLPPWVPVELSVMAGLSFYSLRGGNFSFDPGASPYFSLNGFYPLLKRLHVGLAFDVILAGTSKMESDGKAYTLDASQGFTRFGVHAVVRYQIF